jgi:multicomponent Na+:H+ antiporter subunit F
MDTIYHYIYITVLIILAIMLFACLIRAIRGPRIADRLVSVNMMGTMVMVMIAVLALMLNEGYLVDVGLIYAMISFLAVVVLSKVYIGIYEENRKETSDPENGKGGNSHGNS